MSVFGNVLVKSIYGAFLCNSFTNRSWAAISVEVFRVQNSCSDLGVFRFIL